MTTITPPVEDHICRPPHTAIEMEALLPLSNIAFGRATGLRWQCSCDAIFEYRGVPDISDDDFDGMMSMLMHPYQVFGGAGGETFVLGVWDTSLALDSDVALVADYCQRPEGHLILGAPGTLLKYPCAECVLYTPDVDGTEDLQEPGS